MRNLIIAFVLMFSTVTFAQMSFNLDNLDVRNPINEGTDVNIGWFMTDDIMVSVGMDDWDNFEVGARYYTGFCDNMFLQATTTSSGDEDAREYAISAAAGWTKALGIWKLQFEPMVVLDDISDFNPRLAWGLRFNL
tara:strand:+ start:23 stop:430 length:408 start_codon:yes stop_codon:yes gene_type:complete